MSVTDDGIHDLGVSADPWLDPAEQELSEILGGELLTSASDLD